MTELATLDTYGALIEPTTVKIQRLLPGPSNASGRISPRANYAASGWRPARSRWR